MLYCLSVTSTFSLLAVLSPPWPRLPSYSLHPFSPFLLPHSHWLHSSILVQPTCSPSPLPSSPSRSIILASHSEQKQHQSNWFCRCAEEPHQLTDWVSRLPSPSGPPYFFLSVSLLLPLRSHPGVLSSCPLFLICPPLPFSCYVTSLSFFKTFPLFLYLYTHSYLSATAEVS